MTHISSEELKALLKKDKVFLLDVREPDEHADYNIGGTLIPLSEILLQYQQIPITQTVIVYCKKGIRSQIAIQRLEEKFGFTNLVNLKGGMDAWRKEDF
ncbi:MAG: rhodanese-like domain-containing protein [Bacteroidota bacterium]|jgi:rhodanese-related sulfurtransferase